MTFSPSGCRASLDNGASITNKVHLLSSYFEHYCNRSQYSTTAGEKHSQNGMRMQLRHYKWLVQYIQRMCYTAAERSAVKWLSVFVSVLQNS